MLRFLVTGLVMAGFALPALAQDPGDTAAADDQIEDETAAAEETVLEEESYVDAADDDFRPSEEIPADQSIPFPTDI